MVKKKIEVTSESFVQKHRKKIGFTITALVTSFIVYAFWVVLQKNFVEKDIANNYICQLVGTDPENGILAMKCMVK